MSKTLFVLAVALGLSLAGCKKDKQAQGTASGSAAGSSMAGSSMAGSSMAGSSMAGSGSAAEASRPAGITPELVALNDKVVAAVKATVDELEAAGTDCAKMAAALDAATAKLKPDVDKLGAMLDKLDEAAQAYYADEMTGELGAAFGAMDPVTAPCKDNAAMTAAAQNYVKTLTGE